MPDRPNAEAERSSAARPSLRAMVIVPIFNEETHAVELMEKFRPIVESGLIERVVMVDDGSTDSTPQILRRYDFVKVHRHDSRQGCGASIRSGYRHALEGGYDAVVVMAGNGKDDPGEIPRLLGPVIRGEADYVQGSRFLEGGHSRGLPPHRRLAMICLTWLFRLFLWRWLTDCTNGFRAYRTAFLKDSRLDWSQDWLGHDYELEVYMHYKANSLGYKVIEVPVSKVYRRAKDGSYSKARLADWFTGLKPLFLLRFGFKR